MKKQPDFQKLFFSYFGDTPRKVVYQIRQDSNRHHDIVFLTSLIHDARFKRSDFALRGKRLYVNINRDCWELGFVDRNLASELYIADARLSVSEVTSIDWSFENGFDMTGSTELWITDIWLDPHSYHDYRRPTLAGHGWSCNMMLSDDNITIKLSDKEVPYLYSQKRKSEPVLDKWADLLSTMILLPFLPCKHRGLEKYLA